MGAFTERFMSRNRNPRGSVPPKVKTGTNRTASPAMLTVNPAKIKGALRGACNVTACQDPGSAVYFNRGTNAYYCPACAHRINQTNRDLPGGPLCTLDPQISAEREAKLLERQLPQAVTAETPVRL